MNIPPPDASKTPDADEAERRQVAEWAARARSGDEDAFGELVRKYHERVFGVIYRMIQHAEDARELAQQTWVKAWQRLDSYKQESQFFTWVYRIAVNTTMDHTRRLARRREVSLDDAPPGAEPKPAVDWTPPAGERPDASLANADVRRAFDAALASLSPEHKAALILREVDGLSYREIADVTRCRIGTVMSRIHYARRLMQEKLRDVR